MASKRVLPHCASFWQPTTSWEVSIIVWRGFNFNYYPLSLHSSRLQKRVLSILCSTASLWLLLKIFEQKVFETNVNFKYQGVKNQKKTRKCLEWKKRADYSSMEMYQILCCFSKKNGAPIQPVDNLGQFAKPSQNHIS